VTPIRRGSIRRSANPSQPTNGRQDFGNGQPNWFSLLNTQAEPSVRG
jgi:hypothetical protein